MIKGNNKYHLPWYELIISSFLLGGLFTFLITVKAVYEAKKKRESFIALSIALSYYLLFSIFCIRTSLDNNLFAYIANGHSLLLGISAILFQYKMIGRSPNYLDFKRWREWIPILFTGALIGLGISLLFAIPASITSRIDLIWEGGTFDRHLFLWDILYASFQGIPAGIILSFWWCRKPESLKPSSIVATIGGASIFFITIMVSFSVYTFLLYGGHSELGMYFGSLVEPWKKDITLFGFNLSYFYTAAGIVALGILFSDTTTISSFFKRTYVIPLVIITGFGEFMLTEEYAASIQGQILYNCNNSDSKIRSKAYKNLERLLSRYPKHSHWPEYAEKYASYLYENGEFEKAKQYYKIIFEKYNENSRYYWSVNRAKEVLESEKFGQSQLIKNLKVPVVDCETYLDEEWMTILSIIKYWEKGEKTESDIKMSLKAISKSKDQIKLKKIKSLVDIDDVSHLLGYNTVFVKGSLDIAKKLIDLEIPFISVKYSTIKLIYGYDNSRNLFSAYNFNQVTDRTEKEARKTTDEVLMKDSIDSNVISRLKRIELESKDEVPYSQFSEQNLTYFGDAFLILAPEEAKIKVASALNTSVDSMNIKSNGWRSAYIAFRFLELNDPKQAVEWANRSYELINSSFPLHIGYLSFKKWESREKRIGHELPLASHLYPLQLYKNFFENEKQKIFQKSCHEQFKNDLDLNKMLWLISNMYSSLLDPFDKGDRKIKRNLFEHDLLRNPRYYRVMESLIPIYQLDSDTTRILSTYKKMVDISPEDYEVKIKYVKELLIAGEYGEAEKILSKIDIPKISSFTDYYLSKALIAENNGKNREALKYYNLCIKKEKYTPYIYGRYAALLQKMGKIELAQKAENWTKSISVE